MNRQLKILMLEDSPDDVDLVERELRRGGLDFVFRVVKNREDYERALREFHPEIILSDHSMPQFNSIEAMQIWKEYQQANKLFIPFILVTGSVSEEFAVQSIKAGAVDYILKDRLKRLPSSVLSALEKTRLEKERSDYMSEIISQALLMKEAEHLANFGSWQVELDSGKHRWSDEAYRIFGCEPGEIQPDFEIFFTFVDPDDQAGLRKLIDDAIQGGSVHECEYRITDKKGNKKRLLSKILVKRDDQQRANRLLGFTLDVTRQRMQTEALEHQNQKLMEIAWVQSHEVRAPLARIMGLIEIISRYPSEDSADLQRTLDRIVNSANELDDIIRKIVRKTEEIV